MNRDWKPFFIRASMSLKHMFAALLLVPIFFLMLNTHYSEANYFSDLLMSIRIGVEYGLIHWILSTSYYAWIYQYNPSKLLDLRKSVTNGTLVGFINLLIASGIVSLTEPFISGKEFGLQSISVGVLLGGLCMTLSLYFFAYRETQNNYLKLRAESAESNLNVLKNQMQPHFLFNSLNSLAELIDSNRDHASSMTQKLSDLYREILDSSKEQSSNSSNGGEFVIVNSDLAKRPVERRSRAPIREDGVFCTFPDFFKLFPWPKQGC